MHKLVIFWNLMKKTEKQIQNYVKKVEVWPKLHENSGCHGNVKYDGHTIDISKFPQRMNEQPLKVSAPRSKSSFRNFEKTLLQGWHPSPTSPLYVQQSRNVTKTFVFIQLPLP